MSNFTIICVVYLLADVDSLETKDNMQLGELGMFFVLTRQTCPCILHCGINLNSR